MDGTTMDDYRLGNLGDILFVALSNVTDSNIDRLFELKLKQAGTLARPYDTVVRAMGWKHNSSIYGHGARPLMQSQKKYARMTHEYESVNIPDMYFCGTLSHGKDFKRAAGGFIHGFRYTARALHRILEVKYESEKWPSLVFTVPSQIKELAQLISDRQNSASAPYQMFYTLGDAMIFKEGEGEGKEWTVEFMEDVPVDYLNVQYKDSNRMWWTFGFNGQRRTLEESIKEGTGFEPWIWYWKPGTTKSGGRYREVFRAVENLHTDWSHKFIQENVIRWIGARVKMLRSSKTIESAAEWNEDKSTNVTALGDFEVVSVDMVLVSHLDVPITILRGDEIWKTMPADTTHPKETSFDGETWTVQYKLSTGENVVRSWELKFENGIYQEIHLHAEAQPWDAVVFNEDMMAAATSASGGKGKGKDGRKASATVTPPYSHATFLLTHAESFCDLMGPGIMDALTARGVHNFDSFEDVKARLPNNAAWTNLFEQVRLQYSES